MFPILPVLILLLLQGPSNVERLAREGRLPAALEAVHQELRLPAPDRTQREETVLVSLMALLGPGEPEPPAPKSLREIPTRIDIPVVVAPIPPAGFVACRRTRDGPFVLA